MQQLDSRRCIIQLNSVVSNVESTTMHPALIISLLGTYVQMPCGSAGARTYFVQAKAGVLALAYVCERASASPLLCRGGMEAFVLR